MSFQTQFMIEFLLPFTGCRKVLGYISAYILSCAESKKKKKEENNISTIKTYQMPNK